MAVLVRLSAGCCGLLPFSQPLPPQKLLQGPGSAKIYTGKVWLKKCWCYGKAKGRNRLGMMQKAEKLRKRWFGPLC